MSCINTNVLLYVLSAVATRLSTFFPHFRLKLYADVQDQLLVNVNKSLWEVMRTYSDEEVTLHKEIMLFLT